MRVTLVLSLLAVAAALVVPGFGDLLLLAGPMALAALILLWRGKGRRPAPEAAADALPEWPRPERKAPEKPIVVDGSNVMYWRDNSPRIETLREVLAHLRARGYAPGVVFDANAGYLLIGRYQHDHALGRLLGLPEDRVMVVPKGEPADPVVLAAARDLGAPVLSNDRYRDWAASHPEVQRPGQVIRGGYRDGGLWLDLPG